MIDKSILVFLSALFFAQPARAADWQSLNQLQSIFQNSKPAGSLRIQKTLSQAAPKPAQITEEKILIPSHGNWTLKGRLAKPTGSDSLIILVHGSGPFDMDHSLAAEKDGQQITADGKPTKIFKDLSAAFTANGFMVYRYDKRGVTGWNEEKQGPKLDMPVYIQNTVDDFVKDAAAIVRFFRNSENPPKRIILAGISEGTIVNPLAAMQEEVDGLILLSAAAHRVDYLVEYQFMERTLKWAREIVDEDQNGLISQAESLKHSAFSIDFDNTDADKDGNVSIAVELKEVMEKMYKSTVEEWNKYPWFPSHARIAPSYETLPKYPGPILLVHGEADEQTPLSEAELLVQELNSAGHKQFWLKTFPGLGHGFSPPLNGWQPTLGPLDKTMLQWLGQESAKRFLP